MKFIVPTAEELSSLRADPLLWEQELDCRPEVAEAIEKATGMRAGRVYWRSPYGHLYALELADLGRGRPSMAMVYGHWDRYEPRPPEHQIDEALEELIIWVAEVTPDLNPDDVMWTLAQAGLRPWWPGLHRGRPPWLGKYFPWEQKAVRVNGRAMSYIDEGDPQGHPVLLLSGNPTWGFLYRDFIAPLTQAGFRAIAPDWVGCGYSDHPRVDAALTMAHHISDLVGLMDALKLRGFVVVGQDWGGPQGVGAALQRLERFSALVLMNTWLYTDCMGAFHASPRPWTTWHAPIIGQFFSKRLKVVSHHGPSITSRRGMTEEEIQGYHHVFDEPDSDHVCLTWPRTIPLKEGDRGWADMKAIERRLPEIAGIPTVLLWAPEDMVFPIEYANRLKELLPHAEGPILFDKSGHFLQDDRGPDLVRTIVDFLNRTVGKTAG